jgi:uncharacterized membrane protein YfcA
MTIESLIGIIIIGICAGILSSMVGIGGGIVIVPSLVLLLGMSQHNAQGTTLAMLSFPVSLVAALTYYKKGMVDWKVALILCLGFVVGGYFGSKFAINLSPLVVKKVFAVIMIGIAVKYLFFEKEPA